MWSASSSTVISTASSRAWRPCTRSSRRPGQATTMSTPRRSASICGLAPTPPNTVGGAQSRAPRRAAASRRGPGWPAHGWARAPGRTGLASAGASPAVGQAHHHRQGKGDRLAGTGAAAAEQVPTGESVDERRLLDRERVVRALVGEHAQEGCGDAELGESRPVRGGRARRRSRHGTGWLGDGDGGDGGARSAGADGDGGDLVRWTGAAPVDGALDGRRCAIDGAPTLRGAAASWTRSLTAAEAVIRPPPERLPAGNEIPRPPDDPVTTETAQLAPAATTRMPRATGARLLSAEDRPCAARSSRARCSAGPRGCCRCRARRRRAAGRRATWAPR